MNIKAARPPCRPAYQIKSIIHSQKELLMPRRHVLRQHNADRALLHVHESCDAGIATVEKYNFKHVHCYKASLSPANNSQSPIRFASIFLPRENKKNLFIFL
jgi:hypothetical protein